MWSATIRHQCTISSPGLAHRPGSLASLFSTPSALTSLSSCSTATVVFSHVHCTRVFVCVCVTHTHKYAHTHTHKHKHAHTHTRTQAHAHEHKHTHTHTSTHTRCSSRCCCWFSTASPPLPLARPPTRCAETRHHTRRVYLEHLMRLLRVLQRKMMYPANVEDLNQDYAQSIESQSCFRAARACGCACICGCACACICVCLPACLSVCLCPACLPLCLILHACISLPFSSHPLFVLFLWQTEYRQEAGNVIMFISCFTTTVCMQVRYTN